MSLADQGGQGGRPPNAWESRGGHRKRKLVRLYNLTNLTKLEIRKVLKAEGFDPSESDIQKKLRSLLPKDYAKDHRKYRSSDDSAMKVLFSHLHRCKNGRISKSRRYAQFQTRPKLTTSSSTRFSQKSFEMWTLAFRNYSGKPLAEFTNCLSSISSPESQITISSRLMIDGSGTGPSTTKYDLVEKDEIQRQAHPSQSFEVFQEQATWESSNSTFMNTRCNDGSLMTLDSLKRRLSNRSSASIRHIYSVLRLSSSYSYRSSTSWRSSWKSMASFGSSNRSDLEAPDDKEPVSLSKTEQELWTEIIDETQVLPSPDRRPTYAFPAPGKRSCCNLGKPGYESCMECGFSSWHELVSDGQLDLVEWDNDEKDKFGNTLLHCAAASGHVSLGLVSFLVSQGFDISAKNVSGQNFLHTLGNSPLRGVTGMEGLRNYVSLLHYLRDVNFPLSDRDYQGRTILHVFLSENSLFKNAPSSGETEIQMKETMSCMYSILEPEFSCVDNQGYKLGDLLENWRHQIRGTSVGRPPFRGMTHTLSKYSNRLNVNISFRYDLSLLSWRSEAWLERLKENDLFSWVDRHGDTPLTAILKKWRDEDKELQLRVIVSRLIKEGVEVNMRDRNGNTALAIASIRGSRPCVAELLGAGAFPNSRNYDGVGIIAVATTRMQRARTEGKNKCYARILSCMTLLSQYGAVAEPTDHQEWMPASTHVPRFVRGRRISGS